MKILQLISSGGVYGAEVMMVTLAKSLERLGCKNLVGVFNNVHRADCAVEDFVRAQGLLVKSIPCRGKMDWKTVGVIRRCIRKERIDLIHTHGYKADIYGYAATRPLKTPCIATSHYWTRRTIPLRLYAFLDQLALSRFGHVAAVSDEIAGSLRRFCEEGNALSTIDNGIDLSPFDSARPTLAEEIQKGSRLVVGTVGRLVSQKGFGYFLRAARDVLIGFPDTLFVVVGEGPERRTLEASARELGLEKNLVFTGQRRDMPGIYSSFDIFVLPSVDEGMPIAALEALAARVPVVATRVGAVPKLIIPERTGVLVEPGDAAGLTTAIKRLLSSTRLREDLSQRGHAWVRENFSAEAMARRYLKIYQKLLQKRATEIARVSTIPTVLSEARLSSNGNDPSSL